MQHACHLPADSVPALQRTPAPHVRMRHRAPEACSFGARPATRAGLTEAPNGRVGALPAGSAGLGGCWPGGAGLQGPAWLPLHLHSSKALVRAAVGAQLVWECPFPAALLWMLAGMSWADRSSGQTGSSSHQTTSHLPNTQQAASPGWSALDNSWVMLKGKGEAQAILAILDSPFLPAEGPRSRR